MSTDVLLAIGTTLVGIITALLLCAIPWAYKINGRLTRIEVQLEFFVNHWGGKLDDDG